MHPGQPVQVTNRRWTFHQFSERQRLNGFTAILIIQSDRVHYVFFAAAIADANMDLSFSEEEEHDKELGLACRASTKEAQ